MGVVATFSEDVTEVEPGDSATCTVKLFNDGSVVDSFHLDILGDAKEWTTVSPSEVRVFPGEVATAEIVFDPPRDAKITQGRTGYALRVFSQEDTDNSAIVEGVVQVTGFQEMEIELLSRTLRGSRSARGRLALDNLGNAPVTVRLTGADDDGKLRFRFRDSPVTVAGGTTRVVPYRLVPRSRFLRGEARTHVYRIQAKGDGIRSEAAGSLVQPAMLAPWMPKALLLAAGVAVVAFVMFPTVFAPEESSLLGKYGGNSQDKESDPPAPASSSSDGATPGTPGTGPDPSGQGTTPRDPAGGGAGAGSTSPGPAASGMKTANAAPPVLTAAKSTSLRLEAQTEPGKPGTYVEEKASEPVTDGEVLALSDLSIENPAGDSGTIRLRRDKQVLYEFDLKDAQKQQYWTEPLTLTEGQKVVLDVSCTNANGKNCTPAVAFAGRTYTAGTAQGADASVASTNLRLQANSKPGKAGQFTQKKGAPVPEGRVLALSDLNIENLAGDSGTIRLRRDDQVLYEFDLKKAGRQWHWTEPLTLTEGQKVVLDVSCTNTNGKNCTPAVAFSGRTLPVAP